MSSRALSVVCLVAFAAACGGGSGGSGSTAVTTHAISGAVTGATTQGVTIALGGARVATTVTEVSGAFRFTGLPDGTYTLVAARNGFTFAPPTTSVVVAGADATATSFVATAVPLPPVRHAITGSVQGAVLAGVSFALAGSASGSATSDSQGRFSFANLADGGYTVTPSLTGFTFQPASAVVTVSGADVVVPVFTASPQVVTRRLAGTITGPGAQGTSVLISGDQSVLVTSGVDGTWAATGLPEGSYVVTPMHTGFDFSPPLRSVTVSGGDATGVDFLSVPVTFQLIGTVTGTGAERITIALSGAATASTTTDGSGNYSFSGLASGSYTLTPTHVGFTFTPPSQAVTVNGASATVPPFAAAALPPTYTISGKVSGAITANVPVYLRGDASQDAVTDGSGNYAFSGLSSGSYSVTPVQLGYTFSPDTLAVTVGGASVPNISFVATASQGALTFVNGTSIYDIVGLYASPDGSNWRANQLTTTSLLPGGTWTITHIPTGIWYFRSQMRYGRIDLSGPVMIGKDGTTFWLLDDTGSSRDLYASVSGATSAGVALTFAGTKSGTAITDANGNVNVRVPDGSYTVTPAKAGFAFSPTSRFVTAPSNTVQSFTAAVATYPISGQITSFGDDASGITVQLSGAATATVSADSQGRYTFPAVPAGSYTVTPVLAGYTFRPASRGVSVTSAAVTGVNFTVPYVWGTLSGPNVAGITMTLSSGGVPVRTASVYSPGTYSVLGVPDGVYTLTPSLFGYTFTPAERTVTVAGLDVSGLDFTVHPVWEAVTTGSAAASFFGVRGTSATDVWAVGSSISHWDGNAFTAVTDPVVGDNLMCVWAASPSEAWAGTGAVARWNGATWSLSPPAVTGMYTFYGIWGSAANDVWMAGTRWVQSGANYNAYGELEHWNGSAWSTVSLPVNNSGNFTGVWGSGPNDVWIPSVSSLLHWNGATWSLLSTPDFVMLQAVAGTSSTDAWAVGYTGRILHWNGTAWSNVASPTSANLFGVWAFSPTDAWAVGDVGTILHWNGQSWTAFPSGTGNMLRAVWGASPDDLWAVGISNTILHYKR